MENLKFEVPAATLQHANARMLNRYMPWIDSMLTVTFGKTNLQVLPSYAQALTQVRHLGVSLNSAVWSNKGRFDAKCQILYVPIIEGARTAGRIHAHILLGNVKSSAHVLNHLQSYVPASNWLAPRFELKDIYDADGISWYVAKETHERNKDAIAWEIALIPKPLLP